METLEDRRLLAADSPGAIPSTDGVHSPIPATAAAATASIAAIVIPAIQGDTDSDGDVDFGDFVTLGANFEQPGDHDFSTGDFDGDGIVSFDDFVRLATNYGTHVSRLIDAFWTSETEVVLTFDQPLAEESVVASNFAASYCVHEEPCVAAGEQALAIVSATLSDKGTQVTLATSPRTTDATYIVRAEAAAENGPVDAEGQSVVVANTVTFDVSLPRVVGAASTSNTSVIVAFSEAMADNALNPQLYVIVQENVNTEAGALLVTAARFTDDTRMVVELTTMSQNELTYTVTVVAVTDAAGNPLAPGQKSLGVLVDPTSASFPGTPPNASRRIVAVEDTNGDGAISIGDRITDDQGVVHTFDSLQELGDTITDINGNGHIDVGDMLFSWLDTDCDGLTDNEEQRGWVARVTLSDGTVINRDVTSDPWTADTDLDGLSDSQEAALRLDPRDKDTDDDLLNDEYEFNVVFSSPSSQDTDGDGLSDGSEHDFFHTSPLLADTDGDQLTDDMEVITDNRNPRLADMPRVELKIGNVDLRLDVRFEEQTSEGTTTIDSKSVESTLVQAQEQTQNNEFSTTRGSESSNTHGWFAKLGAEFCISGGCETKGGTSLLGFGAGAKFSAEGGGSGSYTSSFSSASTRATQQALATSQSTEKTTSLSTDREVATEAVVTRLLESATMGVEVSIVNASNIAFSISDIEITALIQDPRNPREFVPVATLFAASDAPISIGPLAPERGPFRFVATEAFPELVENLMANPRGVIFRVANFEIVDEAQRNFAFVDQDINDRTAFLEIDYAGNLPLERHQVSTNSTFDAQGNPLGITMRQALEDVLGLEFVPAAQDTLDPNDPDDAALIERSFSTRIIDGVEALWRVKGVSRELTGQQRDWWVLTPRGLITPTDGSPGRDFNSTVVFADQDFAFKFVQDLDGDRLSASEEALYRSIDSDADENGDGIPDSRDSDRDGIDDDDEVYGVFQGNRRVGWTIALEDSQDAYKTFANPGRADTDLDGLTDCQELARCPITVFSGTDGIPTLDGKVNDAGEPTLKAIATFTLKSPTDPSKRDTDGDGLADGVEIAGFQYTDLVGNEITLTPSQENGFTTNPLSRDTDRDSLADLKEIRLGTNPTEADGDAVLDDDADGLVNLEEKTGWKFSVVRAGVFLLDDGDQGFFPNEFALADSARGFGGDHWVADTGPFETEASWNFSNLPDGQYRVSVTWPASADLASSVIYPVFVPATGERIDVNLNQQVAADDFFEAGVFWEDLTTIAVTGGGLHVVVFSADGRTIADAIRIERLGGIAGTYDEDSLTQNSDTDDDGLTDWEEFHGCRDRDRDVTCDTRNGIEERFGSTNPRSTDTDGDGLTDREEVDGFDFQGDNEKPYRFTNPLDYDTDNDGLSDGVELGTPWEVRVIGKATYKVFSDPTAADADGDGLNDAMERELGTDPYKADTDEDGALDGLESHRRAVCAAESRCISSTDPLEADHFVTVFYDTIHVAKQGGDLDGDADGPGDFSFRFQVGMPQASGALKIEDVVSSKNFINEGKIRQCDNDKDTECHAQIGQTGVIQLYAGAYPFRIDEWLRFAVAESDLFTVEGLLQEQDAGGSSVTFYFGGLGSTDGVFRGTELNKGSFVQAFRQINDSSKGNPADLEVTVHIKVE